METIDIVELFEKCINGRGGCDICPHKKEKSEDGSPCLTRLGRDVINHVNALKAQIEYYEEVIEEYETAEFERQELADKLADTPLWAHDGSSSWTMELGDCTVTASGIPSHAEGVTTTASGAYTPVEVGFTRSSGYDLGRLDAISSSSEWKLEPVLEKVTEAVEAELKKKDKKPRWFEKWTEKT